ncbi:MAG: HAD family hydrolase [Eubacterium sp.]|jgi:pyrophosphatase PpaX
MSKAANENKNIDTVIFDYDGTLADTNRMVIESWQYTYKTLLGHEEDVEKIRSSFGEALVETMAREFPDTPTDEALRIYREFQWEKFKGAVDPVPGMLDIVREIKNRGYKLGIVTSRLRGSTHRGLKYLGMDDLFDAIIACEDTDKHKPLPEPVFLCLDRLGSDAEHSVMIGDSMFDIDCAHNAGVKAILVEWTGAAGTDLAEGERAPEYKVAEAEDILNVLEEMNSDEQRGA